jgi:two-component system, chemotaxis family, response regulator Rcp1
MPPRNCVLFIEGDVEGAHDLNEALDRLSEIYAVHVVKSGAEALSYIKGIGKFAHRREYPAPTVIVSGASDEELRAVEWVRGQRELNSVRVIVLVDFQDEEIIARAYHAGAHSCLLKSEDFADLRDILMLVGRYWMECSNAPSLSASVG